MLETLAYAVTANLVFSVASLWFTDFARSVNPLWINAAKTVVALTVSAIALLFIRDYLFFDFKLMGLLAVSGLVGLCIGDLFMLEAMRIMGGSRMVMMFGLTPFITGVGSYLFFGSTLSLNLWIGVSFMVACLFFLSFERFKTSGEWQIRGLAAGVIAVFLDSIGLLITKFTYNEHQSFHPFQVNFQRSVGAVIGFIFINYFFRKIHLTSVFLKMETPNRTKVIAASFLGTFLSLSFYLKAISLGHLSIVSSISGTGPLFTQIFECAREKKWPHYLWWIAFTCMCMGFWFFSHSGS